MLRRFIFFCCVCVFPAYAADLPPYLNKALTRFNPSVPADWACTITTVRGSENAVERFDPSRPVEQQWTLLQLNHRPASKEEIARSSSYHISTSANPRATFTCSDIDLGSLHLISEDQEHAEFHATFRDDLKDPILHRLELQLFVSKTRAVIEKSVLLLTAPYSPILTVKMLELRVETTFDAPSPARPALPIRVTSRFRGRVFLFKSIEEDTETSYSDFTQVQPLPPAPPATPP